MKKHWQIIVLAILLAAAFGFASGVYWPIIAPLISQAAPPPPAKSSLIPPPVRPKQALKNEAPLTKLLVLPVSQPKPVVKTAATTTTTSTTTTTKPKPKPVVVKTVVTNIITTTTSTTTTTKPKPKPVVVKAVVTTTTTTTTTSTTSTTKPPPVDIFQITLPSKESNLTDPFSLRVAARKKEEIAARAAEAAARPAPAKVAEKLDLQGIWYDTDMKVAFISDQAVPVGGTILGWELVAISREKVVLVKGSATKTLKLEGKE